MAKIMKKYIFTYRKDLIIKFPIQIMSIYIIFRIFFIKLAKIENILIKHKKTHMYVTTCKGS